MSKALAPLGLYVHWPYCARICPYCDFNVYKSRAIDAERWRAALIADIERWAARIEPRTLTSIYFGGGTPSLAPVSVISGVIERCAELFGLADDVEITLEANPTHAEQNRFSEFAAAGINRLSLGVQSLRDDALLFLGRDHSAADARRAVAAAQKQFGNVTFDLIYARPNQTLDEWRTELGEALVLGVSHLSLYQLTIEPGTAFARQVEKARWRPAPDERCADQFALAQEMTAQAGLPSYETSNHAAPGAQSRHNLLYWRYHDYIGVGPGAHGRLTTDEGRLATENIRRPDAYLRALEENSAGASAVEILDDEAQLAERLSMGLRLVEGITLYADDPFYRRDERTLALNRLVGEGYLAHNCGRLSCTEKGRPLLNRILYELLA